MWESVIFCSDHHLLLDTNEKTASNFFEAVLRSGRDSNPRPHA